MRELVLATFNRGKRREFEALLVPLAITVRSLDEFPGAVEPAETGATFEENALLKARAAAAATGRWALADDSGLAVEALGGAPGIHSARYAPGSDADRRARLLEVMAGVPEAQRAAAFVCALALVGPSGVGAAAQEVVVTGRCEGRILRADRGTGGFGYDPIFQPIDDPAGRSMAELTPQEKSAISHRGRAFRALVPQLARVS